MAHTNLTKTAMEKRAAIWHWPAQYLNRAKQYLINPIKEKGLIKGVGSYLGRSFIPKSHLTGLNEKIKGIQSSIAQTQAALSNATNPAQIQRLTNQLKRLQNDASVTMVRAQNLSQPQAYRKLMSGIGSKNLSMPEKALAAKELLRAGGHYTSEGLNAGFMWGFPAYGVYEGLNAPEGEKGKSIGRTLGSTLGFAAAGPLGFLPSVAGSSITGDIGDVLGEQVGEYVSPTSPYRKFMNYMKDVNPRQLSSIPAIMARGVSMAPKQIMSPTSLRAMDRRSRGMSGF